MRWKWSVAPLASTVVLAVGLGLFAWGNSSPAEAITRREAVDLLQPLVGNFEIELTQAQRRLVGSACLEIQADILQAERDRLPGVRDKYQKFLAVAGGYIWGLTNQLDAFADDASNLNLAMVELRRFYLALGEQTAAYDRSLEIAESVNCVAYPEHFVAGLHQVRADHQRLTATVADLDDFINRRLAEAFTATECHLFDIDNPDCH